MLFFMFLHPPSHDATLYSARLINQRNLPDATSGDNHALCHPPLYGLFNWYASNQFGGYRQKKAHPECMPKERAVTESAYLTANT